MAEQIGVLEIMDANAKTILTIVEDSSAFHTAELWSIHLERNYQARDAVAELIEAVSAELNGVARSCYEVGRSRARLSAALARVQGA